MHTSARLLSVLTLVATLWLTACDAPAPAASAYQVLEKGQGDGRQDLEVIYLNNCDGKAPATQTAERGQSVQIEAGAEVGVSAEVLQAAVLAKYTTGSYTSKNIQLTAPPGTNMYFKLRWTMAEQVGVVTNVGPSGATVNYRRFAPIDVQIAEQGDQGGCSSAPGAGGVTPPAEAQPGEPTRVPDTPIPDPPTSAPPTAFVPPGPVLETGQTYATDGVALTLLKADVQPDRVAAIFMLDNNTGGQILFSFGNEVFLGRDNIGETTIGWVFNRCVGSSCGSGPGDSSLEAGESLKIDMEFAGLHLTRSEVTEVLLMVRELSRVKNVSWRVPITH